ncbi:MAG: hypothetical protein INQ03_13615 [Candidatus Heimdallarchaeota archaeon]|nr:hypothetical protein [Candidatus Heimdallarchaeota archaeon]
MPIEYKNYSEELLEAQFELIKEVTKDWKGFFYPNKDQLRKKYENIDVTTKHYMLEDDKLLGFISTAVEEEREGVRYASLQVPFIRDNDPDVEDFLMEKAIKALARLDAKVINTYLMDSWTLSSSFLVRHEFERTDDIIAKNAQLNPADYDLKDFTSSDDIVEVDPVVDLEALVKVFLTEMEGEPEEMIRKSINNWNTEELKKRILTNVIIKDNEGIIAHAMMVKKDDDTANMAHVSIYREGYRDRRPEIFKHIIKKAQEHEIKHLNFYLYKPGFEALDQYNELGVQFDDMRRYSINFLQDDYDHNHIPLEANKLYIIR